MRTFVNTLALIAVYSQAAEVYFSGDAIVLDGSII